VVEAVRQKYAANVSAIPATSIRISGKEVEEVGFEKIQKQISELKDLRIVVLDGLCISGRITEDSGASGEGSLAAICPNIRELDLSRSLFEDINEVMTLIGGLGHLESLKVDGNRFSNFTSMNTRMMSVPPYSRLASLSLDDTLISWKEVSLSDRQGNMQSVLTNAGRRGMLRLSDTLLLVTRWKPTRIYLTSSPHANDYQAAESRAKSI